MRGNRYFTGKNLHARIRRCHQAENAGIKIRVLVELLLTHTRDTEVEQFGVTVRHDHDVARLDVGVDDAATMRILERLADLADNPECPVGVDTPRIR